MNFLKGSFLLKVFALLAAIAAYLYVHNEMYRIKTRLIAPDPSYKLIKLTAKHLPLKGRIATEPPDGYRILEDQVTVRPTHVIAIGPEALLEEASHAQTALIDVSDNTKTIVKRAPLESVAGIHLSGEPTFVEVTVPIAPVSQSSSEK